MSNFGQTRIGHASHSKVYLDGIAVQFYRGIGEETQYIAPFTQMNFFVGANNAGKSIVLNLLAKQMSEINAGKSPKLEKFENYRLKNIQGDFVIAKGINLQSAKETIIKEIPERFNEALLKNISTIIEKLAHECNCIWLRHQNISSNKNNQFHPDIDIDIDYFSSILEKNTWYTIWSKLTNQGDGSINLHWIPETLQTFYKALQKTLPEIHLIPAKRQFGKKDEVFEDSSGKGLLDKLQALQSPDAENQQDKELFNKINAFLQNVTGKNEALLEVPASKEYLQVHIDNKVLPLEALGTGIHEVVIIAAICTIYDNRIMCIEEPEIHLHPLLQRKLISYLQKNTNNQYFIATHSAAFIDLPDAHIFHVTNNGIQTSVRSAITKNSQLDILHDLGYQASDLLQTNFVIWVEGPSDRIYLTHWLKAINPELIEGIHYSIMFYGGALIAHLSASEDITDFISLLTINQNMAIVIDSDKSSAEDELKPHATRILEELKENEHAMCWITQGREVENYLDYDQLQQALKDIHPRLYARPAKKGEFEHAFYFQTYDEQANKHKTYENADKVKVARRLNEQGVNLDILDLKQRVAQLAAMIARANHLELNDTEPTVQKLIDQLNGSTLSITEQTP